MEVNEIQQEAQSAGNKAIIFGVLALVVAALFGWTAAQLSSHGPESHAAVVAAVDLPALGSLRKEDLKVVQWPATSFPKGAFETVDEVLKLNQISTNALVQGEPILLSRLGSPERGLGISLIVEPNMRAFVLQVDGPVAAADLLHPGAFVDVAATLQDTKRQDMVTRVILQNVQILAVGDNVDVEPRRLSGQSETSASDERDKIERHRVVTLLVNLKDVEPLTLAVRAGKIDLSLRSNKDSTMFESAGTSLQAVFGTKKHDNTVASSPEAPAPHPVAPHVSQPRHHRDMSGSDDPAIIKVHR